MRFSRENTEHCSSCRHHYSTDNQGSHTFNHTCGDLLILVLKSINNRQDQPGKPPWARCQCSQTAIERYPDSARTWKLSSETFTPVHQSEPTCPKSSKNAFLLKRCTKLKTVTPWILFITSCLSATATRIVS